MTEKQGRQNVTSDKEGTCTQCTKTDPSHFYLSLPGHWQPVVLPATREKRKTDFETREWINQVANRRKVNTQQCQHKVGRESEKSAASLQKKEAEFWRVTTGDCYVKALYLGKKHGDIYVNFALLLYCLGHKILCISWLLNINLFFK